MLHSCVNFKFGGIATLLTPRYHHPEISSLYGDLLASQHNLQSAPDVARQLANPTQNNTINCNY